MSKLEIPGRARQASLCWLLIQLGDLQPKVANPVRFVNSTDLNLQGLEVMSF